MSDPQAALRSFKPSHEHFVGIDSDGCAFDTMELKHKECFVPNTILHYGLQAASSLARETWEFVNLYSQSRGTNRFLSLLKTLDLLGERPEVLRRGVRFEHHEALRQWVASGLALSNPTLKEEIAASKARDLERALEWSEAVNRDVAKIVHGVSPFPHVRECLEAIGSFADSMCVSATPGAALENEWKEHDIARHVRLIAGQEVGSKKDVLRAAMSSGYSPSNVLMIGDAPGDLQAARSNGALFFPIVPGDEEASWERLEREGLARFRNGAFAGEYETRLVEAFLKRLPSAPPWKR